MTQTQKLITGVAVAAGVIVVAVLVYVYRDQLFTTVGLHEEQPRGKFTILGSGEQQPVTETGAPSSGTTSETAILVNSETIKMKEDFGVGVPDLQDEIVTGQPKTSATLKDLQGEEPATEDKVATPDPATRTVTNDKTDTAVPETKPVTNVKTDTAVPETKPVTTGGAVTTTITPSPTPTPTTTSMGGAQTTTQTASVSPSPSPSVSPTTTATPAIAKTGSSGTLPLIGFGIILVVAGSLFTLAKKKC